MEKIDNISQIEIGNFIKFSGKEGKEKFSYIGEVIDISNQWVRILCYEGEFELKVNKKNTLEKILTKPTGWKKYKDDPEKYRLEKNLKKIKEQENKAKTLSSIREQIYEFVAKQKDKTFSTLHKKASKKFKNIEDSKLKNYIKIALMKKL